MFVWPLLFAFVNATTQLISTRRVAHGADKGAGAAFTHVFVAVIPHTRTHARTHERIQHGRSLHYFVVVVALVSKEVGGGAVTTIPTRHSRALLLALALALSCSVFPVYFMSFPSDNNNIQITLFLYTHINLISYVTYTHSRAHTHTRCAGFDCPASTE